MPKATMTAVPGPVSPSGSTAPPDLEGSEQRWLFCGASLRIASWRCLAMNEQLTPERQMPWDEVTFAHTGMFRLHAGDRSHLIDGTSVALLNAGIPFRTSHPVGCGEVGSSFVVAPGLLRSVIADEGAELRFRNVSAPCCSRLLLSQRQLVRALERGSPVEPLQIEEEALAIVAELLSPRRLLGPAGKPRRRVRRDDVETAETAREYIASRYTQRLQLDEIATACGVSVYRLCRTFLADTSMTVHRYVSRLRLAAALEHLAGGERNLTSLALELGFSSHSHFSWAFRREFNLSPSAWRGLFRDRRWRPHGA
jgi:AraC family transcriptional regulator